MSIAFKYSFLLNEREIPFSWRGLQVRVVRVRGTRFKGARQPFACEHALFVASKGGKARQKC